MKNYKAFSCIKNLVAALIFFTTVNTAFAQEYLKDLSGKPILLQQYESVEGSPFLYEKWNKGTVTLDNGTIYKDISLKYDQVRDVLLFESKGGEAFEFVNKVKSFKIVTAESGENKERVFRSGYKQGNDIKENNFIEVLAVGKVELLKKTTKQILEESSYESALKKKNIHAKESHYLSDGTALSKIKMNEKSLLTALKDKDAELNEYLKKNNLKIKKEEDVLQLVNYYNSL